MSSFIFYHKQYKLAGRSNNALQNMIEDKAEHVVAHQEIQRLIKIYIGLL
jgi:hypothetical protein